MMEAMCGRIGCNTGYLNEFENGAMLKDGKFAGDGDGSGSQLGDCAGGEKPKKGADGFSVEPAKRNWCMGFEFAAFEFIKE